MSSENRCPDCQVGVGEPHEDGCDVARCLVFGEQRLMHAMTGSRPKVDTQWGFPIPVFDPDQVHDCGQDVWTGEWPGIAECREFGWWVQDRNAEGLGYVPCSPDAPGATPDLNRLHRFAQWDQVACRWRQRESG